METNSISTIADAMGARVPAPAALTDLPGAVGLVDENVGTVRQVHLSKRTRCPAAGVSEVPVRYLGQPLHERHRHPGSTAWAFVLRERFERTLSARADAITVAWGAH